MTTPFRPATLALVAALAGDAAFAQDRPTLTPGDYGRWETLAGGAQLSPDGRWLAHQLNRVNEANELRIQSTAADTAALRTAGRSPLHIVPFGTGAAFSSDSRWAAYLIGVSAAEREKAVEAKRPIRTRLGLVDLVAGTTIVIERIASFQFSADGHYLALRGFPPDKETTDAVDLIVRELPTGTTASFGNVTEFAWADRGATLAFVVATDGATGNGIQLYDAARGRHRVLESGTAKYRAISWRKHADDLAVLRTVTTSGWRDTTHALLAWRAVSGLAPTTSVLEPGARAIPPDQRITERRQPEWSDDGALISFGLTNRVRSPDSALARDTSSRLSDVEVWHGKDFRVIPMQKVQERTDLGRSFLSVWRIADGAVTVIGTDLLAPTQLLNGWRFATEAVAGPYRRDNMFGRAKADIHLVNVATGARRPVAQRVRYFFGGSAAGGYLIFFRAGHYWTVDAATGTTTNITAGLPVAFADTASDTPAEEFPPFTGFGGVQWSADDRFVYLNDEYDVWRVAPDGSGATRLTAGRADSLVARLQVLDREARGLDPRKPLYLSLTGVRTKRTGFAWIRPRGSVERIVLEDARLSRLAKADSVDLFVYQRERFDDSPDLFVAAPGLAGGRQVTRTNPFQADFAWGKAELVDYTTSVGRRLQGALFYPAGYRPGTRYPMIVNPYEIRSTELHAYSVPSERSYYNIQAWSQNGYFVLLPDIVFRWREPGPSTVEALEAAVAAVTATGMVDPARVGLVGHSWGGYEATYVATRSHIFAAAVAGAPITDFISMMGAVHWTPGMPETQHWETGQARMEVPFWEDFDAHIRSSPVARVHELKTPLLMEFGDVDGTVDFRQGVEFYNFARRAGNEQFVLLVYPGEDHGLVKKENQLDYHRRILEWFGHYLKGQPAPAWMTEGVSWLDRKRALEDAAPKPRPPADPPG